VTRGASNASSGRSLTAGTSFATRAPVPIADELRAAIGAVFGLRRVSRDLPRATRVAGLLFYPIVGAMAGVLAGLGARLTASLGAWPAAAAAVLILAAASGGDTLRRLWPSGPVVVVIVILAKVWAVATLPEAGRTVALGLAGMLGRWATVVQCYGGRPLAGPGPQAELVGRARLREFGWASTIAFGTTLAVLDAIGLVVLLLATLTTIALRVRAYRRAGGIDDRSLAASSELVETIVLVALALLARSG
jgi:cobalamin synthase